MRHLCSDTGLAGDKGRPGVPAASTVPLRSPDIASKIVLLFARVLEISLKSLRVRLLYSLIAAMTVVLATDKAQGGT
jgi:hypothetical protein